MHAGHHSHLLSKGPAVERIVAVSELMTPLEGSKRNVHEYIGERGRRFGDVIKPLSSHVHQLYIKRRGSKRQ